MFKFALPSARPTVFGVWLLWLASMPWALASVEGADQSPLLVKHKFNPRSYEKSIATCKAINRLENLEKDIEIHYVDVNPKAEKTLLLVHGWPSLWASWSNQIEDFKNDYHLVVPDLRGFGASTHPGDVESSGTMQDHVSDLTCVLAHAGVQKAVCIGHDWGSQICWEAGRLRPDVFDGIVANILPYMHSAGEFVPTSALVPLLPKLGYTIFFSTKTADAVQELDKDIRKSLRVPLGNPGRTNSPPEFLTSTETFMRPWDEIELEKIPFFTQDEEDYWVEQYSIQGFGHTLQFYTHGNRYGSWKYAHDQGNFTILQPALNIFPTKDPVADWAQMSTILGSEKYVSQLTVKTIETSHWTPLEKPEEFNRIVREWLITLPKEASSTSAENLRIIDEL